MVHLFLYIKISTCTIFHSIRVIEKIEKYGERMHLGNNERLLKFYLRQSVISVEFIQSCRSAQFKGKQMKKDSKWKDPMLNKNSQRNINLNKLQILFPTVSVVSAISTSLRACV